MVADALGPPAATRVVVPGQPPTVTPPAIAPGMVHIEVDPDAPYVAGHLSAADLAKATAVLAYLRERGVLVTACATGEQIVLVIAPYRTGAARAHRRQRRVATGGACVPALRPAPLAVTAVWLVLAV